MIYQFINDHSVIAHWVYWAFGFALPALFFAAILLWTLADGKYLSRQSPGNGEFSHSEPVVLLLIGFIFLFLNKDQLQALPVAALIRITNEPAISKCISPGLVGFAYITYTLATLTIFASLAKAFWTHVRLEQGEWGKVSYYEAFKGRGGFCRITELVLRCVIALMVVLLQKHFSVLKYVHYIEKINDKNGIGAGFEADFLASFAEWQADLAVLFMGMYVAILIWLLLAWSLNRNHTSVAKPDLNKASLATLLSTAPGLVIAWLLYFTATGHGLPTPGARPVDVEWWVIVVASTAFALFSVVILLDLGVVIIWQVYPVVAKAWSKSLQVQAKPAA